MILIRKKNGRKSFVINTYTNLHLINRSMFEYRIKYQSTIRGSKYFYCLDIVVWCTWLNTLEWIKFTILTYFKLHYNLNTY